MPPTVKLAQALAHDPELLILDGSRLPGWIHSLGAKNDPDDQGMGESPAAASSCSSHVLPRKSSRCDIENILLINQGRILARGANVHQIRDSDRRASAHGPT